MALKFNPWRSRYLLSYLLIFTLACGPYATAHSQAQNGNSALSVIPRPAKIEISEGSFSLLPTTEIQYDEGNSAVDELANFLAFSFNWATGYKIKAVAVKAVESTDERRPANAIRIVISENKSLGREGYELNVERDTITIRAPQAAGLFYGVQTLRQMLPAEIESDRPSADAIAWSIPCVRIVDQPRYPWRGLMIDCSRTFWSVDYLKRLINLMVLYKMNVLHLHLTDDQGWRLEIKKYPKLTTIGSKFAKRFNDNKDGFYTQDDIRELVQYAKIRQVMIVPEIDMPGHSLAALTAYPELSCTGGPFTIHPFTAGPNIHEDIFCAGNEGTFEMLQDVLTEVAELFPALYVHIGGDEAPTTRWKACDRCQRRMKEEGLKDENQLQQYFMSRLARFLKTKHRQPIGWDEILDSGAAPDLSIMAWRDARYGVDAIKQGSSAVFTPSQFYYLDYHNHRVTLQQVYAYDPESPQLTPEEKSRILGVQGNMWTHLARSPGDIEAQMFPRLIAIAETGWTSQQQRNYHDFARRIRAQQRRLEILQVQAFPALELTSSIIGQWTPADVSEIAKPLVLDVTGIINQNGRYEIIFQYTAGAHRLDIDEVVLLEDNVVIDQDRHEGRTGTFNSENSYVVSVKRHKPGAHYTLSCNVKSAGGVDSRGDVWMRLLQR